MTEQVFSSYSITQDIAANRPVTPTGPAGILIVYQSTDTNVLSVWNGTTWINANSIITNLGIPGLDGEEGPEGFPIPGPMGPTGPIGSTGPQGPIGIRGFDGEEGPEGFAIPGVPGPTGPQGITGPQGPQGPIGIIMDGEEGPEGFPIPGNQGVQGVQGATGPQGSIGFAIDGLDGEQAMAIPGVPGPIGATGPQGSIGLPGFDGDAFADDQPNYGGNYLALSGGVLSGALTIPAGSAAAPALNFTGDVTSGFYSVSAGTIGLAISGAQAFTFAANTLTIGNQASAGASVVLTGETSANMVFTRYTATASAAGLFAFQRGRGTIALPATVSTNDSLGSLNYNGYGGSLFKSGIQISATCIDPTPSDTAMGGQLTIKAAAIGAVALTTLLTSAVTGHIFAVPVSLPYSKQTPVTGFTITVGNGVNKLILTPAGTLAAGTVNMPAAPIDGHIFTLASSQTITALTMSGNGNTLLGALTTIAANGFASWSYALATTTWYRIG